MVLPSDEWFTGDNEAPDIASLIPGEVGSTLTFECGKVYNVGTELEDFSFSPGNPIIRIDAMASPIGGTSTSDLSSLVSGTDPFDSFAKISSGTFDSAAFLAELVTPCWAASPSPALQNLKTPHSDHSEL